LTAIDHSRQRTAAATIHVFFVDPIQIEFWIFLVLSFFGYLPGIVYAVWVIIKE
jgi:uncharacterized membrane protein YqaE (UPF0057 family)